MSRARWRLGPGAFTARPKLLGAMATGLAVVAACALLVPDLRPTSAAVAGWDAFCALYLGLVALHMAGQTPSHMRARSAREDEGGAIILVLVVAACAASLGAVAAELAAARQLHGVERALHVGAGVATVALSWCLMQTVFALHYAREYYAADAETGDDAGGLAFPGDAPPDDWDFLHFAIIIGVAAQTADIAFTSQRLRRLGTAHSLIAFVFNTLIVALTINLAAELF